MAFRLEYPIYPPPGIEVLTFAFFRFILDYKYQNNLF